MRGKEQGQGEGGGGRQEEEEEEAAIPASGLIIRLLLWEQPALRGQWMAGTTERCSRDLKALYRQSKGSLQGSIRVQYMAGPGNCSRTA